MPNLSLPEAAAGRRRQRAQGRWPSAMSVNNAISRLTPSQKHQPELPHPNLVAVGQHSRMDRLPVYVRAVETAHIDDPEFASFAMEFGMTMADGCVVGDDVVVGMAACRCDRPVKPKLRTGVG